MLLSGLGAYPTDSYYDPGRPSWVPYWWDTPTESALKYNLYPGVTTLEPLPEPPVPPAVGVPPITSSDTVTDRSALDKLIAEQTAAWKAQTQGFFTKLAEEEAKRQAEKKCGWYQSLGSDGITCQIGGTTLWLLAAGGGALLLVLAQRRRR